MNKDEILAMQAGSEIDTLIAEKIMGVVENYSTDIVCAWKVVERIGELGLDTL